MTFKEWMEEHYGPGTGPIRPPEALEYFYEDMIEAYTAGYQAGIEAAAQLVRGNWSSTKTMAEQIRKLKQDEPRSLSDD